MSGSRIYLKVVVNKEKTKVLFAEANADFINVLLSFLALPLGKMVKFVNKNCSLSMAAPGTGSLSSLYKSLSNLDTAYFCVGGAKQMLLDPQTSLRAQCSRLKIDVTGSTHNKFYVCPDTECPNTAAINISHYSDIAACQNCGKSLNREIHVEESIDIGGAFLITPLSFTITDDLRAAPIVTGTIQTLKTLGIADTQGTEIMFLDFDTNEGFVEVLFNSETPLTDLIFKKAEVSSAAAKPEAGILLHHKIKNNNMHFRKMVLKVCLQKSTNKFLFAEATDEFVEFLFSFMMVPLGGVEFLLGGKTGLNSIDNLYISVSKSIDAKYFTTPDTKTSLINPKLSNNQFLLISEAKYGAMYIKKQTVFFIKDDLTVSSNLATNISILNGLGVPRFSIVFGFKLE